MKVAYLEDEPAIAEDVCEWLTAAGHEVQWFQNGLECAHTVVSNHFDVCIFDRKVPGLSGTDVLARLQIKLRNAAPPVIFTTGLDTEEDMVSVLKAGADDYIVKPLSRSVLLARVEAVYRRACGLTAAFDRPQSFGQLRLDPAGRQFYREGKRLILTERETDLAIYFFLNIGRLLSRELLIQIVWGQAPDSETRTVDVHVGNLRRKLRLTPDQGWRLASIYRHGYRLEQQK